MMRCGVATSGVVALTDRTRYVFARSLKRFCVREDDEAISYKRNNLSDLRVYYKIASGIANPQSGTIPSQRRGSLLACYLMEMKNPTETSNWRKRPHTLRLCGESVMVL